jgi:hypothetical protein
MLCPPKAMKANERTSKLWMMMHLSVLLSEGLHGKPWVETAVVILALTQLGCT